jgi:hypothetical protein
LKKGFTALHLFLFLFLGFRGNAALFADQFSAKVVSVNVRDNQITLQTALPKNEKVIVQVTGETEMNGVESLKALEIGEEIILEAAPSPGIWKAQEISRPTIQTSEAVAQQNAEIRKIKEELIDSDPIPFSDRISRDLETETLRPTIASVFLPREVVPSSERLESPVEIDGQENGTQ